MYIRGLTETALTTPWVVLTEYFSCTTNGNLFWIFRWRANMYAFTVDISMIRVCLFQQLNRTKRTLTIELWGVDMHALHHYTKHVTLLNESTQANLMQSCKIPVLIHQVYSKWCTLTLSPDFALPQSCIKLILYTNTLSRSMLYQDTHYPLPPLCRVWNLQPWDHSNKHWELRLGRDRR